MSGGGIIIIGGGGHQGGGKAQGEGDSLPEVELSAEEVSQLLGALSAAGLTDLYDKINSVLGS